MAVNTTAGTASEMTRFAIITDTERKVKVRREGKKGKRWKRVDLALRSSPYFFLQMAVIDWRTTPTVGSLFFFKWVVGSGLSLDKRQVVQVPSP